MGSEESIEDKAEKEPSLEVLLEERLEGAKAQGVFEGFPKPLDEGDGAGPVNGAEPMKDMKSAEKPAKVGVGVPADYNDEAQPSCGLANSRTVFSLPFWKSDGRLVCFIHTKGTLTMTTTVKKTISLPAELAQEAEAMARSEGKTLCAVVQETLRLKRAALLKSDLEELQDYWSRKAKERGILTEQDLERYVRK